jgi:cytochrome c oxidase subunit I+III
MVVVETPARARSRREAFEGVWHDPGGLLGWPRTIQNIPIAHRYMATAFVFFLLGGVQALLLRIQLGTPENTFLDARTYNQIFTMHGTTMMFLFVIPFIEALANYILPLLLGTRDLPFPRLTALSYWTYLFGGLLLYSSFLFDAVPDGGWFAYVPLSGPEFSPGLGLDFWDIGLSVAEVAALGAAAELTIGILRMRAPGMALHRLPLFAWAMLVTAVMIIFAFTPLIVGTALLELDRKMGTRFFDPAAGGKPLLWQHIFWVFGHPEVYIMLLPAVGIVSHVVQTFARRPLVGYPLMVLALVATAFLSFGLWVHHMFTTGLAPAAMGFFTAASLMVAIPSGVQVFAWIATLWGARLRWRTPLLFALGFIAIFVAGGLTGVMLALVPFNTQAHDSHFVVAHFHYTLIGGVVFPLFAGLYYWLPKIMGRMLNERLGRWNFWTMFVFFNVAFLPMHGAGLLGMPRRVYTYPPGLGWEFYNLVTTIGAFGFALGVLLFVVNVAWSARRGAPADPNPWEADTLEWSESSPPSEAQFPRLPAVHSRHPLWDQPSLAADAGLARTLAPLHEAPTRWRGGLVVSVVEARPLALVHLPQPTVAPFLLSVGFLFLFAGAIVDYVSLLAVGAIVSAVALVLWFWPQRSERLAMDEVADDAGTELPLAVAGPMANGWWGTVVVVIVLATALVTLLASYFYLVGGQSRLPHPGSPNPEAVAASAVLLGSVTAWWGARQASAHRRRWALAGASALLAGALVLSVGGFVTSAPSPQTSAYASAVMALLGFQWLVVLLELVMLGVAQLWAWLAADDERGRAVALNAAVMGLFAAASGMIVLITVHGTPWLW